MGMSSLAVFPPSSCTAANVQTAEHLTAQSLSRTPPPSAPGAHPVPLETARAADAPQTKVDRSKSTFQEDTTVPEIFRAKLSDCGCRRYDIQADPPDFRSGYDRGHMYV